MMPLNTNKGMKYWYGTNIYIQELKEEQMKLLEEGYCPQLKFVKHRNTREIQHYSQYDDVSGIQEEGDKLSKMYKSQEGRLPDY